MELKQLLADLLDSPFNRREGAGLKALDPAGSFTNPASPAEIITGDNIFVFVGPPHEQMAQNAPQYIVPIGTTTVFSKQVNRQYIPVTEFGYQYSYHVPNKMQYGISLSRIHTTRGDIFRTFSEWMMHHWADLGYGATKNKVPETDVTKLNWLEDPTRNNLVTGSTQIPNTGSEHLLMPFGLLLVEFGADFSISKTVYCQNCKLASASETKSASSPVSEESGQILVTNCVATNIQIEFVAKKAFSIANPQGDSIEEGATIPTG